MRAFLTVLGVIIGTGTIIGVAAILTGFDATMTAVLRSFGPNSIIVFKFPGGLPRHQSQPPKSARARTSPTRTPCTFASAASQRGGCLLHAVPQRPTSSMSITRATTCTTSTCSAWRKPTRRQRAGGYPPGPLLHRRREPPSLARGRDRRRYREGSVRQRGPHRQGHQRGWPRVHSDRHHAAAGGVVLRRHRQPRAAALRHHAEDVPQRARERHRGDRLRRAHCRRRWTKCAPCCASTGACPTASPTTSRSPPPSRWSRISARSPP